MCVCVCEREIMCKSERERERERERVEINNFTEEFDFGTLKRGNNLSMDLN